MVRVGVWATSLQCPCPGHASSAPSSKAGPCAISHFSLLEEASEGSSSCFTGRNRKVQEG